MPVQVEVIIQGVVVGCTEALEVERTPVLAAGCTQALEVACIKDQKAACTLGRGGGLYTGPGGGLYRGPGGGLYTGPGGGLYTGPGGGLYSGACEQPYRSNIPPWAIFITYLEWTARNEFAELIKSHFARVNIVPR